MFASVHVLDPALLERLPEGASDSVLDLYIPLLAEGAHLQGVPSRGAWYDFGRPALYRDAQLRLLPGRGRDRVLVDGSARVACDRPSPPIGGRSRGPRRGRRAGRAQRPVGRCGGRGGRARLGLDRRDGRGRAVGGEGGGRDRAAGGGARRGQARPGAASSGGGTWRGWSFGENDRRGAAGRRGGARPHPRVRRGEAPRRRGRGLGGAALRGRVHAALLPAGERGPQLRARALSRALPARGAQLPHGPRAARVVRAAGARHRRRGRPAGDRAAGGPGHPHAAGRPEGRERGPPRGALPRGGGRDRPAADEGGAGPAEAGLLPDRVRHREAVLGAALLPEALPRGPPRLRPLGGGPGHASRRRSTSSAARSPRGPASCATATTTAAT